MVKVEAKLVSVVHVESEIVLHMDTKTAEFLASILSNVGVNPDNKILKLMHTQLKLGLHDVGISWFNGPEPKNIWPGVQF